MIEQKAPRFLTGVYVAMLLVAFYYLWYRYPFQMNSSQTSPTYGDTPLPLQVGKYLLVLAIAAVVFFATLAAERRTDERPGRTHPIIALAFLGIAGFGLVKAVASGDSDSATFGLIVLPGVFLLAASFHWPVSFRALGRVTAFFSIVVIAVEGVQYYLWQSAGRLPALAYEKGTSVRFGSILDDPNGLALLTVLLVPVVWVAFRRVWILRLAASVGLIWCLWLTQSFTGMASFVAAIFLGILLLSIKRPEKSLGFMFLFALIGAGIYWFVSTSPYLAEVIETKEGSINARGTQLGGVQIDFGTLIGFNKTGSFVESSYVGTLLSVGLIPTVLYFGAGLYAVFVLARRIREGEKTPMHYGLFFFTLGYLIGSINLRLDAVFPVNILYVLAICLSVTADAKRAEPPSVVKPTTAGADLRARNRRLARQR